MIYTATEGLPPSQVAIAEHYRALILQYKKAQIDEQSKHWRSAHPCSIGRWDVTHYKEGALYVVQLALYTERSDGTLTENRRFMRKATSEEGVIAVLETLMVYVDPATILRVDRRLWRRRGAA